jgi:NADH:ubiquinone oxidoreductase subunit F (NADH-binding)
MSAFLRVARDADATGPAILDQPVHYFGRGSAVTELGPDALRDHRLRFGPRPPCPDEAGDDLIEAIDAARLTGRGGAHLPSVVKWRAVRAAVDDRGSVVVANGAEGEPDSRKDAALLEFRPHLVLDGLACAAETLGASEGVIWLHEGASAARSSIARALAERLAAHLDEPPMRVVVGPDRYLTGESSAVVRALSGGPALPDFRTVPSAVRGVGGRPTLVQNVETLARVGLIARGIEPASAIVTVTAADARVVVEAPTDAYLQNVIERVSGSAGAPAVLLGGYGGVWCRWTDLEDATLAEPDLRSRGLSLGAGVLAALAPDECGLARTAHLAGYLADQSARQCGPCLFGLRAVADSMAALARGGRRTKREHARLATFMAEVRGRGACGHPDGAVRMVASALDVFADDAAAHLRGRCLATGRRP